MIYRRVCTTSINHNRTKIISSHLMAKNNEKQFWVHHSHQNLPVININSIELPLTAGQFNFSVMSVHGSLEYVNLTYITCYRLSCNKHDRNFAIS